MRKLQSKPGSPPNFMPLRSQGTIKINVHSHMLLTHCMFPQTIPQKFWFQSLDRTRCSQVVQTNKVKILQAIREVVRPGSILIAPMENNACSYNDLLPLKDMFPTIISVETLRRHNTNRVCCEDNLDVIWRKALDVCEQAQFYNHMHIQQYLTSYMWQQMFGAESFERLLHQFSIHN